jgi:hypothetical protein
MHLLECVAVVYEHVLLVTHEEEVAALVESHPLAILYLEGFILSQFIVQDVVDSDLVQEGGCHVIA